MIKTFLAPYFGWLYVGLAVAAVAGAIWVATTIYNRGYDSAELKYTAAISELKADFAKQRQEAADAHNAEVERQAAVQDAAKAREANRIAEMEAEAQSLEDKIKELQREASEDPDAGRVVLGAPSVQRINKVR